MASKSFAEVANATGVAAGDVAKIFDYLALTGLPTEPVDQSAPVTYGSLVDASIAMLTEVRAGYRDADHARLVPPAFPPHVQIQTIAGCNASCVMCAMSSPRIRRIQHGRMSDDLFEKIVDECSAHVECEEIALYLQNEPLLDRQLEDKVRLVKDRSSGRICVRIVTNGSLLDDERIDGLLDAGVDRVAISINAFTAETYRRIMGGLDLDRTLANIYSLLDKAPPEVLVTLTFMVTSINEHEISQAIEYWSGLGVLCGAYGINTHAGNVPQFEALRAASVPEREKECFMPLDSLPILCTGDVLLCCTDWARESVAGSVASETLYEVWHSEPVSGLRRDAIFGRLTHPICAKCMGQTRVRDNLIYEGGPGRVGAPTGG